MSAAIIAISLSLLSWLLFFGFLELQTQLQKRHEPAGCRQLGLQVSSNLQDQYDEKYSGGTTSSKTAQGLTLWRVKALFIYPIKSCYPVELARSEVVKTGLKYDRQFSFAQLTSSLPSSQDTGSKVEHQWTFITQRAFPFLTRVKTEVWVPDPSLPDYSKDEEYIQCGGCIVITFPFSPEVSFSTAGLKNLGTILAHKIVFGLSAKPTESFRIPFHPTPERIKSKAYPRENMKIWLENPSALNMSSEIPPETLSKLKYFLGVRNPFTIFRVDTEKDREVFRCAPRVDEVGYQTIVGFADAYPLHFNNLASIRDVETHLPVRRKLDAIRFRSNIYITGPEAYDEDAWTRIRIGGGEYHVVCRTARCKLPNVDPATGERDKNEPLSSLKKYRCVDKGAGENPCLGMQMAPSSAEVGDIRVGDEVEVLQRGEHHYLKLDEEKLQDGRVVKVLKKRKEDQLEDGEELLDDGRVVKIVYADGRA